MGGAPSISIDPSLLIDDDTIPDEVLLWRAIDPKHPKATTFDPNINKEIPSIGILRTIELSVRLSDRTTIDNVRAKFGGWKIAQFTRAAAREAGLMLVRDPSDPKHGLVYDKQNPGKRRSQSRIWKLIEKDVTVI